MIHCNAGEMREDILTERMGVYRALFYRVWYSRAIAGLRSGRTADDIRTEHLPRVGTWGVFSEVGCLAIEDALANRPPKYMSPFEL
jgi:hypothetical protein